MVAYKRSAVAFVLGATAVAAQNGTAIIDPVGTLPVLPVGTLTIQPVGTLTIAPAPGATDGAGAGAGGVDIDININFIDYTTIINSLCPTGLVPNTYTIRQQCDGYGPCVQPDVPHGWEVKTKYCAQGCGPAPTYVPVTECPWGGPTPAPGPACHGAECWKDEVICPGGETYTNWYHPPTPTPAPVPPKCEGEGCNPAPVPTPAPYPPKCEGPYCPNTVTKTYPPMNTTVRPPPMYTGGAVKTAASGALGLAVVALAALL